MQFQPWVLCTRTSKLLPKKLNLIDKHYNSPQFSFLLTILAALLLPCLCRQQLFLEENRRNHWLLCNVH